MAERPLGPDEPPHDVLAAEEFGVPAPDPALHHGPVVLPADPTGIDEPHDVLAAEEFALPAPASHGPEPARAPGAPGASRSDPPSRRGLAVAVALAILLGLRRVRHRRSVG